MANQEHVERLRKGIAGWNKWRNKNKKIQPDLRGITLIGTRLDQADLRDADLTGADLRGADLNRANMVGTHLDQADLRGADLNRANLGEANLSRANLDQARLIEADLIGANLGEANLSRANLSRANLSQTNLSRANLSGADLNRATMIGANLNQANLSGADLNQADLSRAYLNQTTFAQIDLRTTKGLTSIRHTGWSYIELFSVLLPQDGRALHFLRGVGVPDEWIDFWRTTMMHPIQYHSCFISYTNRDELLATRLHADLQAQGVRCWFAPEDMKIGDKIRQRIDEAIHVQDKLLLLLSAHALESDWVETEVETALEKEHRQGRDVLFPIRLDESVMQTTRAWAKHLRLKRHIGDFSRWADPQAYQAAFERLLRDLKQG